MACSTAGGEMTLLQEPCLECVQGLLHRRRRAGHHPGDVAQSRTFVSHPPALLNLVRGQSRWVPNLLSTCPGPIQAQLDPFAGRVHW